LPLVFDDELLYNLTQREDQLINQVVKLFFDWFVRASNVYDDRTDFQCIVFHQILFSVNLPQKLDKQQDQSVLRLFVGSQCPNVSHYYFDDRIVSVLDLAFDIAFYVPTHELSNALTPQAAHIFCSVIKLK
jgi:hypothetical protein